MIDFNEIEFLDARLEPDQKVIELLKNSSHLAIISDAKLRKRWIKLENSELSQTEITNQINYFATSLRSEFNIALASIAKHQSIFWRATRTAERNTLVNNLYLNVILLNIILKHSFSKSKMLVLTDNYFLLNISRKSQTKLLDKTLNFYKFLRIQIKTLKTLYNFTKYFFGNKLVAFHIPQVKTDVIVHTFIDVESLKSFKYSERYFPGIAKFYKQNALSVSYLISGAGNFPLKIFKKMNADDYRIFNEFKLYTWIDFFCTVRHILRLRKVKVKPFFVGGIDASELATEMHLLSGIDLGVANAILRYRLGSKLLSKQITPRLLLVEFEGMILEKMLNLGMQKEQTNVKVFGFQHGAMFENLLCNYPTLDEQDLGMIPDKIICNGDKFKELLTNRGVPENKIVTGSALRYSYLYDSSKNNSPEPLLDLLVLLPMTISDCRDLIEIVEEGLSGLDILVHYKPHPFNDLKEIGKLLESKRGVLVSGYLYESIFKYKVIAGMTTGALLEAGLLGMNVIKIKRLLALDFDTTFMNTELRIEVENGLEFHKVLKDFLNNSNSKKFDENLILKKSYFAPISTAGLNNFLPNSL